MFQSLFWSSSGSYRFIVNIWCVWVVLCVERSNIPLHTECHTRTRTKCYAAPLPQIMSTTYLSTQNTTHTHAHTHTHTHTKCYTAPLPQITSTPHLSTQNATHTHQMLCCPITTNNLHNTPLHTECHTRTHTKCYAAPLPKITSTTHLSTQNAMHTHQTIYCPITTNNLHNTPLHTEHHAHTPNVILPHYHK